MVLTFLYQQGLPRLVMDESMMSSATRKKACSCKKRTTPVVVTCRHYPKQEAAAPTSSFCDALWYLKVSSYKMHPYFLSPFGQKMCILLAGNYSTFCWHTFCNKIDDLILPLCYLLFSFFLKGRQRFCLFKLEHSSSQDIHIYCPIHTKVTCSQTWFLPILQLKDSLGENFLDDQSTKIVQVSR